MDLLIHLQLHNESYSSESLETLLLEAAEHNIRTVLISGMDGIQNSVLFDAIDLLNSRKYQIFIQLPDKVWIEILQEDSTLLNKRKITGGIITGNGDDNPEDTNIMDSIHSIRKRKKLTSVRLQFNPHPSVRIIDSWLRYLGKEAVSDLILESETDYVERDADKRDSYLKTIMNHKTMLHRINFQCSFIKEFRPHTCMYLNSNIPAIYHNKDGFFLCPHQVYNKRHDDNGTMGSAIERIKTMQMIRLMKYASKDLPFTCEECIRENGENTRDRKK